MSSRERLPRGPDLPLLLLIVVSFATLLQLLRTREAANWVQHSERAVGLCADVERKMRNERSAVLESMLGKDTRAEQLSARMQALDALDALEKQIGENRSQLEQVVVARSQFLAWLGLADRDLQGTAQERVEQLNLLFTPSIESLHNIEREERRLRATRMDGLEQSRILTIYIGFPAVVLLAGLSAFISRRHAHRLRTEFLEALAGQKRVQATLNQDSWVRERATRLVSATRNEPSIERLGAAFLNQLLEDASALVGAFYYMHQESGEWQLRASVGLTRSIRQSFAEGEALVGRAGLGINILRASELSDDFLRIESGTGTAAVREVILIPCHHDGEALAVVELGLCAPLTSKAEQLIIEAGEPMGLALAITRKRVAQAELLRQLQHQATVLQSQREELRTANEGLAAQSEELLAAQSQLEERKEELETANASLVQERDALARARETLAARAVELRQANRYKSEFLASMSHELRTPLNSCLILSRSLADNANNNLNQEEVKFAETIHASGKDLLELINAVLDLTKIEAGGLQLEIREVNVESVVRPVLRITQPIVADRGLRFDVDLGDTGRQFATDEARLQQILKNLLSNACKFTEKGFVKLAVNWPDQAVEFAVSDSGIGIAPENLETIFEAFQQGDGTTNRRFGGTGLGLTISRDLAQKLGGSLSVQSELGQGSCFRLTLPLEPPAPPLKATPPEDQSIAALPIPAPAPIRHEAAASRCILLVEGGQGLRKPLARTARRWGFSVISTQLDNALEQTRLLQPQAIVVDGSLQKDDLEALVSVLRAGPASQIPVHIVSPELAYQSSTDETEPSWGFREVDLSGLQGALQSMLGDTAAKVLLVEDDDTHRMAVHDLLRSRGFSVTSVGSAQEALIALEKDVFACLVLDLRLPDVSGLELLKSISENDAHVLPHVIIYTGAWLDAETERQLRRYSDTIIVKGGNGEHRLVDELSQFVDRVNSSLRPSSPAAGRDRSLEGTTVLLAEDDVRNVYALTAVLEKQGIRLVVARNGAEAVSALEEHPEVDAVLMDVMMPVMNGLDATRAIRNSQRHYHDIPILALTAKAMREDKDACIAAGASEYMAKPLDTDQLLALLKIWIRPR